MAFDADRDGTLEEIEPEECWLLLSQHDVGRFAVALPDAPPLVVPVNYVLDGEAVVFRSDKGEKVDSLHGQQVSFEVDEIDPFHRAGWSVLVKGVAYEATHWEVDRLTLEPWPSGEKKRWVRIVPASITGRRIRFTPFEPDPRAYL